MFLTERPTGTVPAPRARPETDAPELAASELEGTGTGTVRVGEERASALAALAARAAGRSRHRNPRDAAVIPKKANLVSAPYLCGGIRLCGCGFPTA